MPLPKVVPTRLHMTQNLALRHICFKRMPPSAPFSSLALRTLLHGANNFSGATALLNSAENKCISRITAPRRRPSPRRPYAWDNFHRASLSGAAVVLISVCFSNALSGAVHLPRVSMRQTTIITTSGFSHRRPSFHSETPQRRFSHRRRNCFFSTAPRPLFLNGAHGVAEIWRRLFYMPPFPDLLLTGTVLLPVVYTSTSMRGTTPISPPCSGVANFLTGAAMVSSP